MLFLAGAVVGTVPGTSNDPRSLLMAGGLVLASVILLAVSFLRPTSEAPRVKGSLLSDTRSRARAVFEMATALGETLDFQKVMQVALDLGFLGLKDVSPGAKVPLIGMVMLFRGGELRIISARGLTRQDMQVTARGVAGVLAEALDKAESRFITDAHADPELSYFAGLQDAHSVLVIPLRASYQNYGVLVFASNERDAFDADHVSLLAAIATQATIALQNAVLYQNLQREKERLIEVEEEARKKLARDLHDGPTQAIAAIAMRVNLITHKLLDRKTSRQTAAEELQKVEDIARRATQEIRTMLFTLRPLVLETQGLVAALNQLASKMKDTHGANVVVEARPDVEEVLDSHAQGVLFYIMEEATNNARKHARAQRITLRVYREDNFVISEVEDNGVGFDVQAVTVRYDERGSLGMINMRERAQLVEGVLDITSQPGAGTRITVAVPAKARVVKRNTGPLSGNPDTMRRPSSAMPGHVRTP